MKTIRVKASIGDVVWFMMNDKISSSKIYSIQVYDTRTWYNILRVPKSRIRYEFWRTHNDTFIKKEEDVFLSKEELIKSLEGE